MARTFGISHIAIKVADLDRAATFYVDGLGAVVQHRDDAMAMLLGPGQADLITLVLGPDDAGKPGGVEHFGFRLTDPDHFHETVDRLLAAGGRLRSSGDRGENQPYALIFDPDGYEIEIWHMNAPLLR